MIDVHGLRLPSGAPKSQAGNARCKDMGSVNLVARNEKPNLQAGFGVFVYLANTTTAVLSLVLLSFGCISIAKSFGLTALVLAYNPCTNLALN